MNASKKLLAHLETPTPTEQQTLLFTLLLCSLLVVIALAITLPLLGVAAIMLAGVALIHPQALSPLHRAILIVTSIIGMVVSRVLLIVIYYTVFFTTNLLLMLFRKDILQMRPREKSTSYWQNAAATKDYTTPF